MKTGKRFLLFSKTTAAEPCVALSSLKFPHVPETMAKHAFWIVAISFHRSSFFFGNISL